MQIFKNPKTEFYIGTAIITALMLISGVYTSNVPQQQADRGLWVGHTREVINKLEVLDRDLLETTLSRYESADKKTPALASPDAANKVIEDIALLQKLTVDNAHQQSRLNALQDKLYAHDIVAVRGIIDTMRVEEKELLQDRFGKWAKALRMTQGTIIGGQLLLFVLILLIYKESVKRRRRAEYSNAQAELMGRIVKLQEQVATENLDLDRVMKLVVDRTQELVKSDGSIIEFVDGEEMVYMAASGSGSPHVGLRINMHASLSGKAIIDNAVMLCEDSETDTRVDRAACKRVGLRSMVIVPLLRKDKPFGVLKVLASEPYAFKQVDIDTLRLLAGVLAARINDAGTFTAMVEENVSLNNQNASLSNQREELLFSNAQFKELATIDGLTKLKNHRSFRERMDEEFSRSKRYKSLFSILFIDVDYFKKFNDRFGHVAGDQALQGVGRLLKNIARTSDFVARYGGEEFAIILPETGQEGAMIIAERLRAAIANAVWEIHPVTISIGVSTYGEGFNNVTDLLDSADKALYDAKAAGRNCVRQSVQQAA